MASCINSLTAFGFSWKHWVFSLNFVDVKSHKNIHAYVIVEQFCGFGVCLTWLLLTVIVKIWHGIKRIKYADSDIGGRFGKQLRSSCFIFASLAQFVLVFKLLLLEFYTFFTPSHPYCFWSICCNLWPSPPKQIGISGSTKYLPTRKPF